MSEEGLETIESTTQKTHEWIARIAEVLHMVAGRVIDPLETAQCVLSVMATYIGAGEMTKVMHSFPHDMQSLFTALAPAA